jgi:RNA polymerase sigma-70 factor (ECF subfamily)
MRKYSQYTDSELMESYNKSGDPVIIGEIYNRYGHLVFGLALKVLKNKENSEDVTMFLFEKLGSLINKHAISYFKSWLYQVARNECLMFLRKNQQNLEVAFEDYHTPIYENENTSNIPSDCFETNLSTAMKELKEEQRMAIDYFYLQKMSYVEISALTKWDLKSVKSYIQNAKRNLKIRLEERCHEK